ncbi:MAG TPA: efflux transporter outer membrane subunit [Steroidobacteraceae bacterium]|nr:efflux transporter outer membrane subunit [Steroidobacteraceae bacterium]
MIAHRALRAGGLVLLLTACVGTPPEPIVKEMHADAVGLAGPAYTPRSDGWWLAFEDPQLDRLVRDALDGNQSLAASLARMRGALEQARAAGAARDPRVDFDLSAYRSKVSANYIYPPPYAGSTFWDGRVGFDLVWNLDFWGRQAALIDQASATAQASALDADAAALAVSGAVSQTYVDFERVTALEQLAGRAIAQREHLVVLTRRRVQAGLDSDVELRTAEANRAQAEVELEQARVGARIATHALATLTGRAASGPASFAAPTLDLEKALVLPAELPADLLAHRPDIAAAKARITAAQAGRTAAHAAFYPNVNLIGFAGFTAVSLGSLPKGDSQTWTLGPAIHLPIFDAGRLQAEYGKATADLDVAVASYNETVLRAVREAADQAARVQSFDQQLVEQQRALDAAEQAYALAEQRYGAGLTTFLTVLNAETQVLAARRQRINLLADRTQARVGLLVALGGSFDERPSPALAATSPAGSKETTK